MRNTLLYCSHGGNTEQGEMVGIVRMRQNVTTLGWDTIYRTQYVTVEEILHRMPSKNALGQHTKRFVQIYSEDQQSTFHSLKLMFYLDCYSWSGCFIIYSTFSSDITLQKEVLVLVYILHTCIWVIPPGWGMICDGVNCYIPWLWLPINIVVISYWRWRDWFHSNLKNCECALTYNQG